MRGEAGWRWPREGSSARLLLGSAGTLTLLTFGAADRCKEAEYVNSSRAALWKPWAHRCLSSLSSATLWLLPLEFHCCALCQQPWKPAGMHTDLLIDAYAVSRMFHQGMTATLDVV